MRWQRLLGWPLTWSCPASSVTVRDCWVRASYYWWPRRSTGSSVVQKASCMTSHFSISEYPRLFSSLAVQGKFKDRCIFWGFLLITVAMCNLYILCTLVVFLSSRFEKSADGSSANIKRENKLYSYEEQMAELELKKVRLISHQHTDLISHQHRSNLTST